MTRPFPRIARRLAPAALVALGALALAGGASAQELARLLPAETVFALGVQDLADQRERLEPFIAEFERLELADAFAEIGGASAEEDVDLEEEMPEALRGLDPLDVIGDEAWVALAVSPFNPLPGVVVLASLEGDAEAAFASVIEERAAEAGVERFEENGREFWVEHFEDSEVPVAGVAWTLQDGLLVVASNPEDLRGVLRRLDGAADPGLADAEGWNATLGAFDPANAYVYVDYAAIAEAATPLASGFGFEDAVERLASALATAGVSGGTVAFTDAGFESVGVQVPNAAGGDALLYALLTNDEPAERAALAFAPADALAFSASSNDLEAWWEWLDSIVASAPELGLGSLDEATAMFGIDVRGGLLDWVGSQTATVTTGVAEAAMPGQPGANLLGEAAYLLRAEDEELAGAGLQALLATLSGTASAFADPTGGAGGPSAPTVGEVAGVTTTTWTLVPGAEVSTAVVDGWAVIATSEDALRAVLEAPGSGAGELAALVDEVPAEATSFTVSDDRAALEGSASQVAEQVQMFAGMGGGADLDFDAVQTASERIEEFVLFIAERLGTSVAWSDVEGTTEGGDAVIVSSGVSFIDW